MSLTRREMCLLFPSALLPALLVTKQTQEQSTLPSVLYPFDKLPVHISTTARSEEHTSELQSRLHLVYRLMLGNMAPSPASRPRRPMPSSIHRLGARG